MDRFKKPKDWVFSYFSNTDQRNIRYGCMTTEYPVLNAVFLPGNKEPIEKYFETINDMSNIHPDWNIWAMDWIGQGRSDRLLPQEPRKMHCEDYKNDVRDLHQFLGQINDHNNAPIVLYGHSRGGHLSLRYASKHHDDGYASAVIATAPMLDVHLPMSRKRARLMAQFATNFGMGKDYIPSYRAWNDNFTKDWVSGHSHDQERFKEYHQALCQNPDLCLDDVTMGWAEASFSSMDWLEKKKRLKRINIPVAYS